MIDTFLAPSSNFNVMVVTGPSGCGKTHYVMSSLKAIPGIEVEVVTDPDKIPLDVRNKTLDGNLLVRVLDPADYWDIPDTILNRPDKFIIVATTLSVLPTWCAGPHVIHKPMELPASKDLLAAAQAQDPMVTSVPQDIHDYHALTFWLKYKVLPAVKGPTEAQDAQEFIKGSRDGRDAVRLTWPTHYSDACLNALVSTPYAPDMISHLDAMKMSGLNERYLVEVNRTMIKTASRISAYPGVFVKPKKTPKVKKPPHLEVKQIATESADALKPTGRKKKRITLEDY